MFCSILVFHVRDMSSSRLISDIYTLFQIVLDCLSSLPKLAPPPKNKQIPQDAFRVRSYSLGIETINTLTLYPFIDSVPPSKTIPREPYPIPDQNGQSVYPFSDLKAQKPYPMWRPKPIWFMLGKTVGYTITNCIMVLGFCLDQLKSYC